MCVTKSKKYQSLAKLQYDFLGVAHTHLKKQTKPDIKGITFEITDEKVISLTNGIVQGMSGSPIIQNGKLIGCVTHVDVNDVHKGYGLYIDWMLENDNV